MASNRLNGIFLMIAFLAVFCAGGWFFSYFLHASSRAEIEALYVKDGESVGIFDQIPEEDIAAAEQIAAAALGQKIEPDAESSIRDYKVPSQLVLTDLKDIAAVASRQEPYTEVVYTHQPEVKRPESLLHLTGTEVIVPANQDLSALPEQESKISLIELPVAYQVIKTTPEYKTFKTQARGTYPEVDFSKQMIIVLESRSDFPDKVFEIQSVQEKDGKLFVAYRVNVLGLDKKINTHSVLAVDKTDIPIVLQQVK